MNTEEIKARVDDAQSANELKPSGIEQPPPDNPVADVELGDGLDEARQSTVHHGCRLLAPVFEGTFRDIIDGVTSAHPPGTEEGALNVAFDAPPYGLDGYPVQIERTALPVVLEGLAEQLHAAGASAVRLRCGARRTCAIQVEASSAMVAAAIARSLPTPGHRYETTDGDQVLIWYADAPPPHAWGAFRVQVEATFAGLHRTMDAVALPVLGAMVDGSGEMVAFDTWSPEVPPCVERVLVAAHLPDLGRLPLQWYAIEWIRRALSVKAFGVRDQGLALRCVLSAHVEAHVRVRRHGDLVEAWQCMTVLVHQYMERDSLHPSRGPFAVPFTRLAYDSHEGGLVAVERDYRRNNWVRNKDAFKGVLSMLTPTAQMRWEMIKKGPSKGERILVGEFCQPQNATPTIGQLDGSEDARRAHGIVTIDFESYPIAMKQTGFTESEDGDIIYTRVPEPTDFGDDPETLSILADPVGWIVEQFRALRTPFRSESDARRFAMLLLMPLLRDKCAGGLTAFFLIGASGSGKGLTKAAVFGAYNAAASKSAPAQCYMSIDETSEHELNLKYAEMGGRLFLSFTETVKAGTQDLIIKQNERASLTARSHREAPREIMNRYITVADAVEGAQGKIEVQRRVVTISMRSGRELELVANSNAPEYSPKRFRPSEFIKTMITHGPALIEGLRRRLEARSEDFVESMSDDSGRSMATNAAAAICGVALGEVVGGALTEIWELIADLVRGVSVPDPNGESSAVRATCRRGRPNDGKFAREFGYFSFSEVNSLAQKVPEHAELARNIRGGGLAKQIETEFGKDFGPLHAKGGRVLVVRAQGDWFVYAHVREKYFVLAQYDSALAWCARAHGREARARLEALKAASAVRFRVQGDEWMRLNELLTTVIAYGDREESARDHERAAHEICRQIGIIAGAGHALIAIGGEIRQALAEHVVRLGRAGFLQAELDLLDCDIHPDRDLIARAGIADASESLNTYTMETILTSAEWEAFRAARLLAPLAATVHAAPFAHKAAAAGLLSDSSWCAVTDDDFRDPEDTYATRAVLETHANEMCGSFFLDLTNSLPACVSEL